MMKNLKLSQWHDGSIKPVHVGEYDVWCGCCESIMRIYFDGNRFVDAFVLVKKWRGVLK